MPESSAVRTGRRTEGAGAFRRAASPCALLIAVAVASGCSASSAGRDSGDGAPISGATTPATGPAASTSSRAAMPPTLPPPNLSTPESAGREWVTRYQSSAWTDPRPSAWIDRVRPVVTDNLAREYEALRDGGGGADWPQFVEKHCTTSVERARASNPPESPATETSAALLVNGTVITSCPGSSDSTQQFFAAVTAVRGADGLWRVDRRID